MLAVLAIGVYVFFAITLFNLKIKHLPMKKRMNHKNDVIYFRKTYNK